MCCAYIHITGKHGCIYALYEAILTCSDPERNFVLQTVCHFHAKVKKKTKKKFKNLNAIDSECQASKNHLLEENNCGYN